MGKPIDISGIESGQRGSAEIEQELEAKRSEDRKKIEAIRTEIIEGGTTKDLLRDLVIVRTHRLDQEVIDMYQDLSARVAAHVGEPVLVIGREEQRTSFSGPGSRRKESGIVQTNTALGMLSSESLELDIPKGDWTFPTERYAFKSGDHRHGPKEIEGSLGTGKCLDWIANINGNKYETVLGKPLTLRYEHMFLELGPPPIELEVYVGDAEIQAHLDTEFDDLMGHHQYRARRYNELAELLDLPKRTIVSEEAHFEEHRRRLESGQAAPSVEDMIDRESIDELAAERDDAERRSERRFRQLQENGEDS